MEAKQGIFIVLEGSDGSGKTTQFSLLKERLKAVGYDVADFDFPRYSKESSYFVKNYLNGRYGSAAKISPYTASLFYALDRFEAAGDIQKALSEGKIVLANRYAGSNMAHQGSKIDDEVEQRSFFVWADNLEFQLLGIPRPDLNFYLRVPAEVSYGLVAKKASRDYTPNKRDEHEQDRDHLKKAVATYDLLCQLFPKDFKAIECTKAGKLMSVADINNRLWEQLKPLLPQKKAHVSHSVVVTLGLTDKTPAHLDADSSDELVHTFKDASLLLKLHLQRAPHKGLKTSAENWSTNGYRFYSPRGLPAEVAAAYKQINEQMADMYVQLHQKLAKYLEAHALDGSLQFQKVSDTDLARPLIPLSALTEVTISLDKSEVATVAGSLLAADTDELRWAAQQLYLAARQKWPRDFDRPLESRDGPVSLNNIIAKLAEERLPQVFSADEDIKLLESRPRLEFDLLAESIYPYSSLSLDEIAEEVSSWPYMQKYDSLKEAASQPEVLKKVRYKMDILSDHLTLNRIIKAAAIKELQIQAFTPRYGYDVPELIEAAGADDLYDACFDLSLKLYSLLQGAGREASAPYATLLGHKVRWQLNINAAELNKVIHAPSLAGSPALSSISEKIAEAHPLLWEVMSGTKSSAASSSNGKSRVKPYRQRRGSKPKKS